MEQLNEALEIIIQQRILQAKREGYKKSFYGYRERNIEKATIYNREYSRKFRLKKKLEKLEKESQQNLVDPDTLGKLI